MTDLLEQVAQLVEKSDIDIRTVVILAHAAIEYHINRIMLKQFGTASFESERMNSKIMSLNDVGIIDDTLRQDLIQIARIRHLFAHRQEVSGEQILKLLAGINRQGTGTDLRSRFLAAVKTSYNLIKQKQEEMIPKDDLPEM